MKRYIPAFVALLVSLPAFPEEVADGYPILAIPRGSNSDVLLRYELSDKEKYFFKEMDAETAKLPSSAKLSAYHEVAKRVGKRYGLTASQSIAFFTRTTFSEFEP